MSIVLSHNTGLLYHRAPERPSDPPRIPDEKQAFNSGPPAADEVRLARALLVSYGIPSQELEVLDIIVSKRSERRLLAGVRCTVINRELPAHSLLCIAKGVYVTDARLTALLAAQFLGRLELVELYYELCGTYEMPIDPSRSYRERPCPASTAELARFFCMMVGARGIADARWALRYVRDGARSPMETAVVMTIVLPKAKGGLGVHGVVMNRKIPVTGSARKMTRRRHFYADALIESARLIIEYNGFHHDEERRVVLDREREHALNAMGYTVVTIARGSLFGQEDFHRICASISAGVGLQKSRFPEDFAERQEELRRFVLRRWL